MILADLDLTHHRPCFNVIRLLVPAKPAMTDSEKFYLWLVLGCHQWHSDKISNFFLFFWGGAYPDTDRQWGVAVPTLPHQRAEFGNTPSGRGSTGVNRSVSDLPGGQEVIPWQLTQLLWGDPRDPQCGHLTIDVTPSYHQWHHLWIKKPVYNS